MELFWSLNPKEFHFIYMGYSEAEERRIQVSWEQTRMAIYYQYCSIPKKGMNPSYNKFKLDHIPFPWDRIDKREVDIDYDPDEGMLTPDEWRDRISKLVPDKNSTDPANI